MNTQDEPFFKDIGARIAHARKERGITQVPRFVSEMLDTILAQAAR